MTADLPPPIIGGATAEVFPSTSVGDEFRVLTAECRVRHTAPETDVDPIRHTLMVSDGDGFFGTAVDVVRSLQLMHQLPSMLVVGVGYPGAEGLIDTVQVRARDLTPSRTPMFARSGGAKAFTRFLTDELVPSLNQRWPEAGAHQIFFGHSLGGLLGCHLIWDEGCPFDAYLLGSPSLWWNNGSLLDRAGSGELSSPPKKASVFFGIGAHETQWGREQEAAALPVGHPAKPAAGHYLDMVEDLDRFVRAVREVAPANSLVIEHEVFADEFHVTVAPLVLSRGLRWWAARHLGQTPSGPLRSDGS